VAAVEGDTAEILADMEEHGMSPFEEPTGVANRRPRRERRIELAVLWQSCASPQGPVDARLVAARRRDPGFEFVRRRSRS
jgi:hypothetical protein